MSSERDALGSEADQRNKVEAAGVTETPLTDAARIDTAAEVKADSSAVNEIDWDNYLDQYTMAAPMPS